jgi:hypothetical protein
MALGILAREKLRFKDSLKILLLKNKLKNWYDIFAEEERKLVEHVAKKDDHGKPIKYPDGHFDFASEETKEEYLKKMAEMSTTEVDDMDIETISIQPPNSISAEIIEALDGFVIFEEKENESAT